MKQDMSFQEKRMLELMTQLPQNRDDEAYDTIVPVIEFEFSEHPNPQRARRQNIKRALKALKPIKRWFAVPGFSLLPFLGRSRFKYNAEAYRCVIDGADCRHLDYGDLFDIYFRDEHSKVVSPFRPWSGVLSGKGFLMAGTYCPQHMQLYHLLMEWIEQEAIESDKGFFKRLKKKGVAFIPIKRSPQKSEHPLIVKWEQAFIEAKKDGIPIMHYKNPTTGKNDITLLIFDNRVLEATMPQGTTIAGTEEFSPSDEQLEAFETAA
jgi:hypothetical protein